MNWNNISSPSNPPSLLPELQRGLIILYAKRVQTLFLITSYNHTVPNALHDKAAEAERISTWRGICGLGSKALSGKRDLKRKWGWSRAEEPDEVERKKRMFGLSCRRALKDTAGL